MRNTIISALTVLFSLFLGQATSSCVLSVRIVELEDKIPISQPLQSFSAIESDICMQNCHEMPECLTFFYNPGSKECRMYGDFNETDLTADTDSQCYTRVCDETEVPDLANATYKVYTTKVQYKCNTGYVGYGDSLIQCRGAQWTAQQFECRLVDCGNPPTVVNAAVPSVTSSLYLSQYTYTCDTTYHLIGTNTQTTCLATGQWSETGFQCKGASASCQAVLQSSSNVENAVYPITIASSVTLVYCEMIVDSGGWMVIQRRVNGSLSFEKSLTEYKAGFGDPDGNFWIGNENLYELTKGGNFELRIDMVDNTGSKIYAKYSTFMIEAGDTFTLTVSGYSGDAGDHLSAQNSGSFTQVSGNGYWWFNSINTLNLNGAYGSGLLWNSNAVQSAVMMVRDRNG